MSGNAVGACGPHKKRSLIFLLSIRFEKGYQKIFEEVRMDWTVNFALQLNTACGRKKSKVVQESSRQRSNKRDNMSQMLLGLCIVSPVGNKCLPLRLSGKSLELVVPSSASVESSERALGVRSRPMGEDINSVCSSGDRTTSRRMHHRTHAPMEVSMLALGESAE